MNLLSEMKTPDHVDMLEKLQCIPLINLGNILSQADALYKAIIIEFSNMQNKLEKALLEEKQLLSQLDSCKFLNQARPAFKDCNNPDNNSKRKSLSTNKNFRTPDKNGNGMMKFQNVVSERDNLIREVQYKNLKVEPLSPVSLDLNMATISDTPVKEEILTTVSKESNSSTVEFVSIEDELISINDETTEINGTPTGRTSPIIGLRKQKNKYGGSLLEVGNQLIFEDNCSLKDRNRSTSLKQRRNPKLKQTRLTYNNHKPKVTLDVSTTNLFDGGRRTPLLGKLPQIESMKGSTEDEDIILPSPTSEHIKKEQLSGASYKFSSPIKSAKRKSNSQGLIFSDAKVDYYAGDVTYMPGYSPNCMDINNSNSTTPIKAVTPRKLLSPKKEKRSPLSPNKNVTNVLRNTFKEPDFSNASCFREPIINSSLSLLKTRAPTFKDQSERVHTKAKKENNKFLVKETKPQFIYKELPVRKQAEKRQLPGWSCRECKEYYGEAYKDDEDKLFEAMQRCSRHRGRFNPERPHTPPGFWDVRMSVPDDTQELNRRNNAV